MAETIGTRCCIVGGGPAGMMLGFLLARAGVDLSQPDTVRAVSAELDMLVARLEQELGTPSEGAGVGVASAAPRAS